MSATPSLLKLAHAADLFAAHGCPTLAAELRGIRLEFAELIDAVADKLDEVDHRNHGLAETSAETRLRVIHDRLRPTPCTSTP